MVHHDLWLRSGDIHGHNNGVVGGEASSLFAPMVLPEINVAIDKTTGTFMLNRGKTIDESKVYICR